MKLVLFILNPLVGLLTGLRDINSPYSKVVIIGFYVVFAYCCDFELTTCDIYGIASRFESRSFDFESLYSDFETGDITDIYLYFVYVIVGSVSKNPKVLFATFALVYGAFSYGILKIIYTKALSRRFSYWWLFVVLIFCNFSIIDMAGVRFFTAALIYVWIVLQYVYCNRKYSLLLLFFLPLIHFSFLPISLLSVTLLFRRYINSNLLLFCFVTCFIISFLPIEEFKGVLLSYTDILDNSSQAFKYEQYMEGSDGGTIADEATTYRKLNTIYWSVAQQSLKISLFILIYVIYRKFVLKEQDADSRTKILLPFLLILTSFAFLASSLSSTGFRFLRISLELLYVVLICLISSQRLKLTKTLKTLLLLTAVYGVPYTLFNAPRLVSPYFWFMPVPVLVYDGIGFVLP